MIKSISALVLLSLSVSSYADNTAQNIRLTNDQQTLTISLPANATTGYQWYVQNYDHDLLSIQDYRYAAPNSQLAGAGGSAIFTFNIDPRFYDAPQVTAVSFVYQQPWNPGQNTSTATVTVSATESNNDSLNWQKYPSLPPNVPMPNVGTDPTTNNWVSLNAPDHS